MAKLDFPRQIENKYAVALNKYVTQIEKKFKEIFLEGKKSNSKINGSIDDIDLYLHLIEYSKEKNKPFKIDFTRSNAEDKKEKEFLDYFDELVTTDFAFELSIDYLIEGIQYSIVQASEQITEILGVDYTMQPFYDESMIEKIIDENVALIKAEPRKYLRSYDKELKRILKEKDIKGQTIDEITEAIQKATKIERNRANLIARDQIGDIYAETTKHQYTKLGLKKFKWVSVGDDRVRHKHREFNGNIYEWDNPPDNEIPGGEIACRCVAAVVREEVLEL